MSQPHQFTWVFFFGPSLFLLHPWLLISILLVLHVLQSLGQKGLLLPSPPFQDSIGQFRIIEHFLAELNGKRLGTRQHNTLYDLLHEVPCNEEIMADTADKNEVCISCCKCSLEYLSAACNRTPWCVDWGRNGWVAYGACHSIALWLPKVRSLKTALISVCCLVVPRALMEMNSLR